MDRRRRIHGHRRIKRTPIRKFELNPGGIKQVTDTAIDASMANVPVDLKKSFQDVAEGYAKGTEGISKGVSGAIEGIKGKTEQVIQMVV